MAGFENDVAVCKNLNFDETAAKPHLGIINAAGKIPIGTGQTFPTPEILGGSITSPDGSITVGYLSPNITIVSRANINTITGNTGGPETPSAGNFNILGTGSITTAGSASTETVQLTGLTNHALLVGAGTATITKVGPTATSGQVLQSAGASADPAFSTATYPSTATGTGTIMRADGTNWVATTATYPTTSTVSQILYSSADNVIGGLATANDGVLITSHTGVPSLLANGTTGQVLTATTGGPASWVNTVSTVTGQLITASGAFTYTPTSGMKYVIVELIGGGGGSGGIATNTGTVAASGGAGGGAYAKFILTAAQVGASLTGSVGAAGIAGNAGNNNGSAGGNTTLATTAAWTVGGGALSAGATAGTTTSNAGGAGGTVTTGTGTILASVPGGTGSYGIGIGTFCLCGSGGSSVYGRGAQQIGEVSSSSIGGQTGFGYGAGASGAVGINNVAQAGAAGIAGAAIFTEFL